MAIGRIKTVDPVKRTAVVQIYGVDDDYVLRDVRLGEGDPQALTTPRPGKAVRVQRDGHDWFIVRYLVDENTSTEEQTEQEKQAWQALGV